MTHSFLLRPAGDCAVLVECADLAEVMGLQAALRSPTAPKIEEVIAAAQTVFISCDSPRMLSKLRMWLKNVQLPEHAPASGTLHILNTVYDGADLTEVARLASMSVEALIAWHSGQNWLAAFGGFAAGFMYLTPSGEGLSVARRASPRTSVPAGSVALGGRFCAVYPGPSPGGWQLLGHSDALLWDASLPQPALLMPSDTVRFKTMRETVRGSATAPVTGSSLMPAGSRVLAGTPAKKNVEGATGKNISSGDVPPAEGLMVLASGMLTTVQDLGRPGLAHQGVSGSGALDRAALRRVNRMVGNTDMSGSGCAGLETVMAGLRIKAMGSHVVAVTAGAIELQIHSVVGSERAAPLDTPFVLRDGETLEFRPCLGAAGFRGYLGVRGGLAVPAVLGSRSTDLLSGLGPAPLRAGAFLPVVQPFRGGIVGFPEPGPKPTQVLTVFRYLPGPRSGWFTPESRTKFEQQTWHLSAQSNRIGLRLSGSPLVRTMAAMTAELPSEGMPTGAIQVPPSGLPVLFLADHPVTGGYPVLGVVPREQLDRAAQLPPGAKIRFVSSECTQQ